MVIDASPIPFLSKIRKWNLSLKINVVLFRDMFGVRGSFLVFHTQTGGFPWHAYIRLGDDFLWGVTLSLAVTHIRTLVAIPSTRWLLWLQCKTQSEITVNKGMNDSHLSNRCWLITYCTINKYDWLHPLFAAGRTRIVLLFFHGFGSLRILSCGFS